MAENQGFGTGVWFVPADRPKPGACSCACGGCAAGRLPAEDDDRPLPVGWAVLGLAGPVVAVLAAAWLLADSQAGQSTAGVALTAVVLGLLAIVGRSRHDRVPAVAVVSAESRRPLGKSTPCQPAGKLPVVAGISAASRGTEALRSGQ